MELWKTDPEFQECFTHFAFEEVINEDEQQLEPAVRYLAILATLIGCGGADAYREIPTWSKSRWKKDSSTSVFC